MIRKVYCSHRCRERSGIGSDPIDCAAGDASEEVTVGQRDFMCCVWVCVCVWPYIRPTAGDEGSAPNLFGRRVEPESYCSLLAYESVFCTIYLSSVHIHTVKNGDEQLDIL